MSDSTLRHHTAVVAAEQIKQASDVLGQNLVALADLIDKTEAERDELRAVLREIAKRWNPDGNPALLSDLIARAEKLLGEKS